MCDRVSLVRMVAAMALCASFVRSQTTPEPVKLGSVILSGSIRSRIEAWDWFTPESGDADYAYVGNHLRLNFTRPGKKFDWTLELAAPILIGLPRDAVASGAQGQLGMGATYSAANDRRRNIGMVFPKQLFLRVKNVFGSERGHLRIGRFEFQDGSEVSAVNPTMAVLKRERVQQRLIGPFVFTHVMRSFDGFHFTHDKPGRNYTLIGAFPTCGVFQADAWGWLKTGFVYGSVTGRFPSNKKSNGEWRLFLIYYHDWRDVLKQDNRTVEARSVDGANIRIGTYGGHYLNVIETTAGLVDLLAIGAGQFGKWGSLNHRAGMVDLEAGIQPKLAPKLKPWFRAGYSYATGDGNPADTKHGTFFQILPTPRPFARFPFFNTMNNEDRFGMLTIRPLKQIAFKTEAHALRLANRRDFWYLGGGAFQPWSFGYQSRNGGGARGLANLYDVSADVTVNTHFAITFYYGYAQGKSVIQAVYPRGKSGGLAYAEMNYRF